MKLNTSYQEFIAYSRYTRWVEELKRRETPKEAVARYFGFMKEKYGDKISKKDWQEAEDAVNNLDVMPSMRALMTAGPALERSNIAGFNCTALAVDDVKAFDEAMILLLNGAGVGFSVERQFINKLPEVPDQLFESDTVIVVKDSKESWAKSLRMLIASLYAGEVPKWDLSRVRAKGERLKTFGGRSSGPEPLDDLFKFACNLFKGAAGRKLTSLECHDLMCMIGNTVVVGGVRRCLPLSSIVKTPTGYKEIGSLKVGDYIEAGGVSKKIIAFENTGTKKLVNIVHRFGTLKCTPEHRVFVFEGTDLVEKPAGEVVEGDRMAWDLIPYTGKLTELPPVAQSTHFNALPVKSPKFLTPSLAWAIGFIQGDGYVSDKTVEVTKDSKYIDSLYHLKNVLMDAYGIEGSISIGKGDCYRLRLNSVSVAPWFKNYIKDGDDIKSPDFIENASISVRASYLAGVFQADGRFREEDSVIEQHTTVCKNFHEFTNRLLLGLGITTRSYSSEAKLPRQDFYTIYITGNTSRKNWIKIVGSQVVGRKRPNLEKFSSPIDFTFPGNLCPSLSSKNITLGSALRNGLVDHDIAFAPSVVKFVEESGEEETCDIEVEDIHCFVAEGVLVHNSAMISLSNLSDDRMRHAKVGKWGDYFPHRALANNSVAYTEKPDIESFMREWISLMESKSGERGIFNRQASKKQAAKNGRRDPNYEFLTNPCCVAGETLILTDKGEFPIIDTVGKSVNIWNGESFEPVTPYKSGLSILWKVTLSDGSYLWCTPNHKWCVDGSFVRTDELLEGTFLQMFPYGPLTRGGPVRSVVSIDKENSRAEMTYCFTEPKTSRGTFNGIVTGNSEIILRPNEMCNLSTIIVRPWDTEEDLARKIRIAALLGTLQAGLTDFPYLRKVWKKNADEEALLGVSMTGIYDNPLTYTLGEDLDNMLERLKGVAVETNAKYAKKIGINQAAAVTCVKPEGTVSQLTDTASGIHTRYAKKYIRTVRGTNTDPLVQMLKDLGVPWEPCLYKPETTTVFSFPMESPEGCVTRNDVSAIDHLNLWLTYQRHWCEHKPSITVSVKDDEWLEVAAFVYKHFDEMSGVSFLPYDGGSYKQAPYQEVSEQEVDALKAKMPALNWDTLTIYELEDATSGSQTLACTGGNCEAVDIE